MAEPMLLIRFPHGGHLSIEFTDDDHPGSVRGSNCERSLLPWNSGPVESHPAGEFCPSSQSGL
jgi:hypothetical protein